MGRITQIACGIVLALGLLGANTPSGQLDQRQANQGQTQAQSVALAESQKVEREAKEAAADRARAQSDLAAQESMARSAEGQFGEVRVQTWAIWASVLFGAIASGVSVFALLVAMGTGRRQLRAYIMPDHISLFHPTHLPKKRGKQPKIADHPAVVIHLKNYGPTPASEVLHWADYVLLPLHPDSEAIATPAPDTLSRVSESAMAPGGILTKYLDYRPAFSPAEAAQIEARSHGIFVRGRVTYRDAFKKQRETNYLLRYQGMWPPPVQNSLYYCDTGNSVT